MKQFDRDGWRTLSAALALAAAAGAACAQTVAPVRSGGAAPVYRCPGNPVLYTDTLSAKEAKDKGCHALEGAPITIVQGFKPRAAAGPAPAPTPRAVAGPARAHVSAVEQRSRDSDARQILETELRTEQERLAALQKDYNNGEPERQGNERNYQKYVDRVAELKAAISRKEGDLVAIRREIAKLPK